LLWRKATIAINIADAWGEVVVILHNQMISTSRLLSRSALLTIQGSVTWCCSDVMYAISFSIEIRKFLSENASGIAESGICSSSESPPLSVAS
jgi:hypothetical protein